MEFGAVFSLDVEEESSESSKIRAKGLTAHASVLLTAISSLVDCGSLWVCTRAGRGCLHPYQAVFVLEILTVARM